MKKQILIGILLIFLLIPSCFATWSTPYYETSDWDTATVDHLQVIEGWNDTGNYAYFDYGYTSDFSSYGINWTTSILESAKREWWHYSGILDLYIGIAFVDSSNNTVAWGRIHINSHTDVYNTSYVGWDLLFANGTSITMFQDARGIDAFGFRLFTTPTQATVQYEAWFHPPSDVIYSDINFYQTFNNTFNVDLNVENVTTRLYFAWFGSGAFDIWKAWEQLGTGGTQVNPVSPAGTGLPEPTGTLPSWLNWLTDIGSILVQLFGIMLDIIQTLLPYLVAYLPYFIIFYLIDVGYASIEQRSLQPVGYAIQYVWDMFLGVVNALVYYGTLIWDIITFWS